jgi:CelD/BcsL family acetyltransferase involved in cellulose biosynthesis
MAHMNAWSSSGRLTSGAHPSAAAPRLARPTTAQAPALRLAWTFAEFDRLRGDLAAIGWEQDEAEPDLLLARARARPQTIAPFALIVTRGGAAVAAATGRLEAKRLATTVGYRTLYAPLVRVLQLVEGGLVAADDAGAAALAGGLEAALAGAGADLVALPPLPVDSELYARLSRLGDASRREPFIRPWPRRRLVLPDSFDAFLASRSASTRWQVRSDARKLAARFGDELRVDVLDRPSDFERLVADLDHVSRRTYQRALGAGFAATPDQRALAGVGLERGWLRAHVLYRSGAPIAFWLCSVHGTTARVRTTGFDPDYARHRVGTFLLMRVIEDACADPALASIDFGPGEARYKRQFGSECRLERHVVVYANTLRARRINLVRSAIAGPELLARAALDATGLTGKVRALSRRRPGGGAPAERARAA